MPSLIATGHQAYRRSADRSGWRSPVPGPGDVGLFPGDRSARDRQLIRWLYPTGVSGIW